jgi:hypothetical protein
MYQVILIIATGLLFPMSTAQTRPELRTIANRLAEFGAIVQHRLEPKFSAAGIAYPPRRLTLIGFKRKGMLEVYASNDDHLPRFICAYRVLAASGGLGPKLRQGDRQVPEGIYRLRELNPNSRFHLSLWLDYPNAFDRARAVADGRRELGGQIMIHGGQVSKGCLALGDAAAEDLFVLAALIGIENVTVIFAPLDFRINSLGALPADAPSWTGELYREIARGLTRYPPPSPAPQRELPPALKGSTQNLGL